MTDNLLDRIRNILKAKEVDFVEKKMIGGDCFMVDDKICVGKYKSGLLVRLDPEEVLFLVNNNEIRQISMGGKPMKEYLLIGSKGFESESDLNHWVEKCLESKIHQKEKINQNQ